MRTVKCPDRDLMGDDGAKSLARKPGVEVEGRRLDLERRLAQLGEIEIDGVVRRRTDRGRHAREHRQRRPVNMAGRDQLHARMTPDDGCEFDGVEEILAIHVPDAGLERRMMQEQQRGPIG